MSPVPKWYERKFDFSFPVELYPNICIRLRGTPARIEELLGNRPRELLVRKSKDRWSAQEHAGHLFDIESLWMARVEDFMRGSSELTVADLSNRNTDEANHNARSIGEILAEFRKARLGLVDRVQQQHAALFARSLLHPRLKKPMRLVDHLYFIGEHDDHHMAWIWELIS
jgi:uncharacterized damage-inducible protein DinB